MSKLTKTWKALERHFDAIARARVQSSLLILGPAWVEKYGYSWTALRGGVDGWPWRKPASSSTEEKEIRRAIRELKAMSDRELRDLGIARSGIEAAVRHGHPDRDFALDDQDEAA